MGVAFPVLPELGRASTTAFGRTVFADAAGAVDLELAAVVRGEQDWRRGYVRHVRRLVEATALSRSAALAAARAGLSAMHAHMEFERDGDRLPLGKAMAAFVSDAPATQTIAGRLGSRARELELPYARQLLRGTALHRQLDRWVTAGVVEPPLAEAVRLVMANPDWLRLDGHRVALLGAASQLGPLGPLTRWGVDLALVDVPRAELWERVRRLVRDGAGRAVLPVHGMNAGCDVVAEAPELAAWLASLRGPVTIGGYTYLDGAQHVLVNAAIDAVVDNVLHHRDDVSLAFLATPTDAFPVPIEAVEESRRRWSASAVQQATRVMSRQRLMTPNYPTTLQRNDGRHIGIGDCLVVQQGPNYALAKHLQRWRALVARATGTLTSMRVAPTTRTQSVMRNRMLAAAYEGAPRFGLEVFDPVTASTLMAALLVHDLSNPAAPANPIVELSHPDDQLMHGAAHAGLWRTAYAPRSVLPLAVLFGLPRTVRPSRRGS
jgi:hypothetical protein